MAQKNNVEARQREFNARLLGFFQDWQTFVKRFRDQKHQEDTDWLEEFCSYVWDSLVCFEKLGRLKEPLRRS